MLKTILVLFAVAIATGMLADQFVDASDVEVAPGVRLDTNQVIIVVVIGAVGGTVRALQGYTKSPNDFDWVLFANTIWKNIAVAVPFALASAVMQDFTAFNLVTLFFAVVGTTEFIKTAQKRSIPSNATDDEIARILQERET